MAAFHPANRGAFPPASLSGSRGFRSFSATDSHSERAVSRETTCRSRSSLERSWDFYATLHELPLGEREHCFAKSIGRRWRFDEAWPARKVAVELEGGVYSGGRHVRPEGFEKDCEKYNAAVSLGWRVLRFTTTALRMDPIGCIDQVKELLCSDSIATCSDCSDSRGES